MGQAQDGAAFGARFQDVARTSGMAHERHGQLFAVGVDGRVGHLGEALLEPAEQGLRLVAEAGQGLVRPHGADGLLGVLGHGHEDLALPCAVATGLTQTAVQRRQGVRGIAFFAHAVQGLKAHGVLLEPAAPGLGADDLPLDLRIGSDAVMFHVRQDHAPGLELAALDDVLFRHVHKAAFRAEHHQAVPGDAPAAGAQPVAVEHGAHAPPAVGEDEAGGTVPGLHEGRVIFVEGALVVAHDEGGAEGLGDHHHQGVGQGVARADEQLQHIVQGPGIRSVGIDDRQGVLQMRPQQGRGKHGLAHAHVDRVAAQGVDLAVMGGQAEGLGQRPRRQGVGGKTFVEHGKGRGAILVRQVGIEFAQPGAGEHALVDDAPAGAAGHIEQTGVLSLPAQFLPDQVLGHVPGKEQAAFKGFGIMELGGFGGAGVRQDEQLQKSGHGLAGGGSQHVFPHRDVALVFHAQAAGREDLAEALQAQRPQRRIPGQEKLGHGPGRGADRQRGPLAQEEPARQGEEDTGAITVPAVTAATMGHAGHGPQGHVHHVMTALAVQIGNKTHTAGIMLPAGIEKTVHMSLLGRLGEWRENVPGRGWSCPARGDKETS